MSSLQVPNYRAFEQSPYLKTFPSAEKLANKIVIDPSFLGRDLCLINGSRSVSVVGSAAKRRFSRRISRVFAMSGSTLKMNLNEYMVTLEKPLGIRFALSVDGKVFVGSLNGDAEKSRIIMVGDTLRKANESSGGKLIEIKDSGDTEYYYKFIIGGQWRYSTASPTERDKRGNLNNIIVVGDIASVRPTLRQEKKDANIVKVIERPLTENERFMLAKAARCVAFSVCPIRLPPK